MSKYRDWQDTVKFKQRLDVEAVAAGMRYDEVAMAMDLYVDQVRSWCRRAGVRLTPEARKRPCVTIEPPRQRVFCPESVDQPLAKRRP